MLTHTDSAAATVRSIWTALGLPQDALTRLHLGQQRGPLVPSSFKVAHLAQSSIALSALAASLVQSQRTGSAKPREISVDPNHAVVEFSSEKFNYVDGEGPPPLWGPLSGLYKCKDGYIRMHDSFINHRKAIVGLLGSGQDKAEVERKLEEWDKAAFEDAAVENKFAAYALRTEDEWRCTEHAKATEGSTNWPIEIIKRTSSEPHSSPSFGSAPQEEMSERPLAGLRVVELSRVLAAPVAGRTLASHGAEVIWVTSPNLPDLPGSDRDVSRGKRTVQLDLELSEDRDTLRELARTADVFIQSYRPGSLESKGFGSEELRKINPGLIYASLSAWSPGPWGRRRGFDSLVQTASGLNAAEAKAADDGVARPLPCQALDHSGGYFLATGIMAAIYKRATEGGGYDVNVSLEGCMKVLKSLGRIEDGFGIPPLRAEDAEQYLEEADSGFGRMKAVSHAGKIDGCSTTFVHMPKPLGSDSPEWLK